MQNFKKILEPKLNEKIIITYKDKSIELQGPGSLKLIWTFEQQENVFDALVVVEAEPK